MEHSPRITDERLRSWLDTNQLDRERLCLCVMSLDRRFVNVRHRQPRGGPDAGRDIEASLADGGPVWGAVGFQNSVSDTTSERSAAVNKFKDDLKRAKEENPQLRAFVFFTNVTLTVVDRETLLTHARKNGIDLCEVFDREHIRVVLDAPDGLSARYQFLQIPLSEAEQAAFFARWGNDLQSLIERSFHGVHQYLAKLELNQLRETSLRSIAFLYELDRPLTVKSMPHFRTLLSMESRHPLCRIPAVQLAHADADGKGWAGGVVPGESVNTAFWMGDINHIAASSCAPRPQAANPLYVSSEFNAVRYLYASDTKHFVVNDLDAIDFCFYASRSLADRITRIEIQTNYYPIWHRTRDALRFESFDDDVPFPWPLTEAELSDPWVKIDTKERRLCLGTPHAENAV